MSNRIVELAKACPKDYSQKIDWQDEPSVKALSAELAAQGFPHLAKAVLGGVLWSRKLRQGDFLEEHEERAAEPGWSWNWSSVDSIGIDSSGEKR